MQYYIQIRTRTNENHPWRTHVNYVWDYDAGVRWAKEVTPSGHEMQHVTFRKANVKH